VYSKLKDGKRRSYCKGAFSLRA